LPEAEALFNRATEAGSATVIALIIESGF